MGAMRNFDSMGTFTDELTSEALTAFGNDVVLYADHGRRQPLRGAPRSEPERASGPKQHRRAALSPRATRRRTRSGRSTRHGHPRIGFAGVIDERMDLGLVAGVADARPDWQLVLLGPIVKIDPAAVPRRPNVHQLGIKNYADLPAYMAGWHVGMLPFARNAATRFISPTKAPEYLAAGLPVVSTSIRDVVRPYADLGLARVGDSVPDFIAAVEAALADDRARRWDAADDLLAQTSWDRTVAHMRALMQRSVERARAAPGMSVGVDAEAA
jgi:glycosyltransferase involved in cell wall biosynthesis